MDLRGKRWGDTRAAMAALGVTSPQTLTKYIKYGLPNRDTGEVEPLPTVKIGRSYRFDLDAVDAWIESRSRWIAQTPGQSA